MSKTFLRSIIFRSRFIRYVSTCRPASTIAKILGDFDSVGKTLTVNGWIKSVHNLKNYYFVHLVDGPSANHLQVVVDKKLIDKTALTIGDAITVTGQLVQSPKPKQPTELQAQSLSILGENRHNISYFDPKSDSSPHILRQQLELRAKDPGFGSFLKLRAKTRRILCEYLDSRGFVHIDPPLITRNDCEGAGESFRVLAPKELTDKDYQYFDLPVFLTVSSQLHLEAMVGALPKVYCLAPAFRAEKSLSRQHLAEFQMLEAEIAFMDSLDSLLDFVEEFIKISVENVRNDCSSELELFAKKYSHFPGLVENLEVPFARITYEEALDILERSSEPFQIAVSRQEGIAKEHEQYLCSHFGQKPVFVTNFPAELKPFYMKQSGQTALCFDLLAPNSGEICGGSVREENFDILRERVGEIETLDWYLELRNSGHPPSAGFGLGFERFLQCLFGVKNIKDCLPFPRWYMHCQL